MTNQKVYKQAQTTTPSQRIRQFPIWQITFPLCVVLIFGIGAFTAFSLVEGRYLFDLDVSPERIKIKTDVDKREGHLLEGKTEESNHRLQP